MWRELNIPRVSPRPVSPHHTHTQCCEEYPMCTKIFPPCHGSIQLIYPQKAWLSVLILLTNNPSVHVNTVSLSPTSALACKALSPSSLWVEIPYKHCLSIFLSLGIVRVSVGSRLTSCTQEEKQKGVHSSFCLLSLSIPIPPGKRRERIWPFCNLEPPFIGISVHPWNGNDEISRAHVAKKKGHVATREAKAGSTVFLLSSQAASPFIPHCALPHLTHAPFHFPSVLPAGTEGTGEIALRSGTFYPIHPARTGAARSWLASTALPTDVETSGLLGAKKSSGIWVVNLWQV